MNTLHPLSCPARERGWRVEATVRGVAGTLVLVSLALALVNKNWLWLTAFVGLNLLQSAFTGWCLMSNFVSMLFPKLAHDK